MELMPGYKKTDIGVIPEDWGLARLEELSAFITKGATPTTYGFKWERQGVVFLRSESITENGIDFAGAQFISSAANKMLNRSEIKRGDILVAITGYVGRVATFDSPVPANINQHVARVRINSKRASACFISHWLGQKNIRRHFESIVTGQAYPQISLVQVREKVVPLPRVAEQDAIAEALSDVDALIAALTRLIAKKRDLRQGATQRLLTGQTRLRGFTAAWQEKRMKQVAKVLRGASPRPIESPVWFDSSSEVGWVRISDVSRSKRYLCETTQRLSPAGIARSRRVAVGSLIMSIAATVGRPAITAIDTCIHDGFVVFQDVEIDQLLLFYVLQFIQPNWTLHGQTGSQTNLNTGIIENAVLNLPDDRAEQEAIAAVLTDLDAEIDALDARLQKTRALKQAMMQALLTGRVRLPVRRDAAPLTKEAAHA